MSGALPALGSFRRAHVIAAAITLVAVAIGAWTLLRPGPLRTPDRIAGLERQSDGIYADAQAALAQAADAEPRLGETVTAVYGEPGAALPTLGVAAGVIQIGHGDEIVAAMLNGLRASGATFEDVRGYPAGREGRFSCGRVTAQVPRTGRLTGTYCLWSDTRTIGAVVVRGRSAADARALALDVRNAVAP